MDLIWFRSFCSGYTFADAGNLEHCAKYLNQTLMTFGFPASLDLFAADPCRNQLQGLAISYILYFSRSRGILSLGSRLMIRGKDRELATLTRKVCLSVILWGNFPYSKISNFMYILKLDVIRMLKLPPCSKLRLKICNRKVMNFKRWLLVIRIISMFLYPKRITS
ncbi:uncharacterized protein LOC109840079 isoform X2 [Asparagus officinalis]|uniref:uncharacterized protein LOC109840079 isoform X2 n=1 Tax=Asparagus officinalis TaxID=4686 RepID=UPI00098E3D79|nr:uncharacterized protein LOC109840079 isoform X2 [Asparagus officinalis]